MGLGFSLVFLLITPCTTYYLNMGLFIVIEPVPCDSLLKSPYKRSWSDCVGFTLLITVYFCQFLQLQWRAVSLLGGLLSHLCLALKLRLLSGLPFLMVILGSPYRIVLLSPPWQARTTNFFDPPGVRLGLLHGRSCVLIPHRPHR